MACSSYSNTPHLTHLTLIYILQPNLNNLSHQINLIHPQTLNYPIHLTKSICPNAPNLNHLPTLLIFLTHLPQTASSHLPSQTCLTYLHITFNLLLSACLHLFLNSPFMILFLQPDPSVSLLLLVAYLCHSLLFFHRLHSNLLSPSL